MEQLLVVGLGIGEDADAALFLGGLALEAVAAPVEPTYGVTATVGYVISGTSVAAGAPVVVVTSTPLAATTTAGGATTVATVGSVTATTTTTSHQ